MKRILFSLLILVGFASAITCVEAVFASRFDLMEANDDMPRLDSIRVFHYDNEKNAYTSDEHYTYYWKNGAIEQTIFWDAVKDSHDTTKNVVLYSESELTGDGLEMILSKTVSNDVNINTLSYYINGEYLGDKVDKFYSNYYKTEKGGQYNEYILKGDTLFENSDKNWTFFYVNDPQDKLKCNYYDLKDVSYVNRTVEVIPNEHNYIVKEKHIILDLIYQYAVTIPNESTTAIRKQRSAVKISPKARYFDLLGRYKFTR